MRRPSMIDISFFLTLMDLRLNHLASVLQRDAESHAVQVALADAIYVVAEPAVATLLVDVYRVRFEDCSPYLDVPADLAQRPTVESLLEKGVLIGAAHHPAETIDCAVAFVQSPAGAGGTGRSRHLAGPMRCRPVPPNRFPPHLLLECAKAAGSLPAAARSRRNSSWRFSLVPMARSGWPRNTRRWSTAPLRRPEDFIRWSFTCGKLRPKAVPADAENSTRAMVRSLGKKPHRRSRTFKKPSFPK